MKRTLLSPIPAVLLMTCLLGLWACGNDATEGNAIKPGSSPATSAAQPVNAKGAAYADLVPAAVPAAYPADRLPLSGDPADKIIKVFSKADGSLFDIKIATTRPARAVVEAYAADWGLENTNTLYMDDLGVANLTGNADGYEIIVNASEKQPEMPAGATAYVAIGVKRR